MNCARGHLLAGDNVRQEKSGDGVRLRCKACVSEQKRRWYARPRARKRHRRYVHHYKYGDPKGRNWDEVKRSWRRR